MRPCCLAALALALLCATGTVSRAADNEADRAAEARRQFDAGTRLYAEGHMQEALVAFEKANEIKPDPSLLYDLAQTHRSLGHDGPALTFFRAFLKAAPYTPNREEVMGKIRILEEEIARREAERQKVESTMAVAAARAAEAEEATRVAKQLSAVAALQAARAEEAQRTAHEAELRARSILTTQKRVPVYKKWWLWTIVGSVVAVGVVTTAVLTRPQVPETTQGNIVF